jgi:hypothetical protein
VPGRWLVWLVGRGSRPAGACTYMELERNTSRTRNRSLSPLLPSRSEIVPRHARGLSRTRLARRDTHPQQHLALLS